MAKHRRRLASEQLVRALFKKASMLAFSGDIELRSAFRKKSPAKLKLWTGSGTTLHLF
jgi:hypothetical protein